MSKEIEVLHKIFELELAPPFELVVDSEATNEPYLYNKYSENIGYISERKNCWINETKLNSLFDKIKRTFSVDELSNDDYSNIAKHLYRWLQINGLDNIIGVGLFSHRIPDLTIIYPNRVY